MRLPGFRIGGMVGKDGQGSAKERVSRMSASSHKRRRESIGTPPSRARFSRTLMRGFLAGMPWARSACGQPSRERDGEGFHPDSVLRGNAPRRRPPEPAITAEGRHSTPHHRRKDTPPSPRARRSSKERLQVSMEKKNERPNGHVVSGSRLARRSQSCVAITRPKRLQRAGEV